MLLARVNRIIARLLNWAIGLTLYVIVFVLFAGVILRYVFSAPLFWSEEIAVLAMIWMTFLAGAILVREDKNVTITVFADFFSKRIQGYIKAFSDIVVLVILIVMLCLSWNLKQKLAFSTTPALRLSEAWFGWSLIVGFGLMLFYQVQKIVTLFTGGKTPAGGGAEGRTLYE